MPMAAHAADGIAASIAGGAPDAMRWSGSMVCISLGRSRGLIQRTDSRDRPIEDAVVTGRAAAVVKEMICRFAVGALRLERRFAGLFWWPRGEPAPRQLPEGDTDAKVTP
jgi:NADH dehydrogenase